MDAPGYGGHGGHGGRTLGGAIKKPSRKACAALKVMPWDRILRQIDLLVKTARLRIAEFIICESPFFGSSAAGAVRRFPWWPPFIFVVLARDYLHTLMGTIDHYKLFGLQREQSRIMTEV